MRNWLVVFMGLTIMCYSGIAQAQPYCTGAPKEYVMEPIKGKVVDKETGAPIESAVVIAGWEMIVPFKYLKIEESLTDTKGEFSFAGWGPIKRAGDGCLYSFDPMLTVFKSGYEAFGHMNDYDFGEGAGIAEGTPINPVSSRIRKSKFNGKAIKLKKFVLGAMIEYHSTLSNKKETRALTEEDWCQNIDFILSEFDGARSTGFKVSPVPEFLKAMHEEQKLHPNCFKTTLFDFLEKTE